MNRLTQLLILVAGGFTTALLTAVYLESQIGAIATWIFFLALVAIATIWLAVFTVRKARSHLSNDSRFEGILHDPTGESSEDTNTDALATLRERYARGELTDEQFEQKLDRLLETETPENAAEWRAATREQSQEKTVE
jgi:uncharacterized membrane protein